MIIIQNISDEYSKTGPQQYLVRINDKVIAEFESNTSFGLGECLRNAAIAVEDPDRLENINVGKELADVLESMKTYLYNGDVNK